MNRVISSLVIKESLQIIRDPSAILISLFLPLFLLFLYGFGVSLDLNHLRLGIVLEESTPEAIELLESFRGSTYFDLQVARDRREMVDKITRGDLRGFLVIPAYFSEFRRRPHKIAPLQVIADGSEPNTANFVKLYTQGAIATWNRQEGVEPLISVESRVWYNEELESRFFLLSGSLAIIMTLIGTLLTALVVAREWERGTMEALMSTPITIKEIIFAKLIPYFILGMLSMVICVFVSTVGYGLPLRGSLWLLLLVSSVFLISALSLGLMISTLAKNQITAYQISMVTAFLPAYILSGFLFEIASMPRWIQLFTYLLPARYFVSSLQTLFLVGNVWGLVLPNMIPMALLALIVFAITLRKTVKRLD